MSTDLHISDVLFAMLFATATIAMVLAAFWFTATHQPDASHCGANQTLTTHHDNTGDVTGYDCAQRATTCTQPVTTNDGQRWCAVPYHAEAHP